MSILALWLLPLAFPQGGQDEIAELKKQIQTLTERMEKLEKERQEAPPPPEPSVVDKALERKPAPQEVQTTYDEGFWFVGPDDKLKIGGSGQFDYRMFVPSSYDNDDTFVLRRLRLYATGVLENKWGYMVMGRYDNFVPNVHNAWVESQHLPWLRFRVGLFKEPFSLEGLHSDAYWDFTERSMMVTNLLPLEDLGAMAYGKVWDDRLEYGVGVFTGRSRAGTDNNDDKDVAARLAFTPFKTFDEWWINKLTIGGGVTRGEQEEGFGGNSFRTQAGTRIWTFAPGVRHDGDLTRVGADIEWIFGPASIKAEWLDQTYSDLLLGAANTDLDAGGFYVQASCLLTGEDKPRNRPVVPLEEFDPGEGKWGAFELAARYEQFWLDDGPKNLGFAVGTDSAAAWTWALNWYLNRHMKLAFDFEHVDFDDDVFVGATAEDEENVALIRFQFEF